MRKAWGRTIAHEDAALAQSQRGGCLTLAVGHRLDAGAEDLGHVGAVVEGHREGAHDDGVDRAEAGPDLGQGQPDEQDLDEQRRAAHERHVEGRRWRRPARALDMRPTLPRRAKPMASDDGHDRDDDGGEGPGDDEPDGSDGDPGDTLGGDSISPRIKRHHGGPSVRNSRSMAPPKARMATSPPMTIAHVAAKTRRKRTFRRRSASAIWATMGAGPDRHPARPSRRRGSDVCCHGAPGQR